MPALTVAVAVSLSRNAWVGACAAAALLLALKRLPVAGDPADTRAMFFAVAPGVITSRFMSIFNLQDPTNRDRMAMLREGGTYRRASADRRRSDMVIRCTRVPGDPSRSRRSTAPAQRAAADCRRARSSGLAAWGCSSCRSASRSENGFARAVTALSLRPRSAAVVAMLSAGIVRIQLRRFRVPDAVPDPDYAAVRGGRWSALMERPCSSQSKAYSLCALRHRSVFDYSDTLLADRISR